VESAGDFEIEWPVGGEDGQKTAELIVTDALGNQTSAIVSSILVRTPPKIDIGQVEAAFPGEDGIVRGRAISIAGPVEAELHTIGLLLGRYLSSVQVAADGTFELPWRLSTPGTTKAEVRVTDAIGNRSVKAVSLQVREQPRPGPSAATITGEFNNVPPYTRNPTTMSEIVAGYLTATFTDPELEDTFVGGSGSRFRVTHEFRVGALHPNVMLPETRRMLELAERAGTVQLEWVYDRDLGSVRPLNFYARDAADHIAEILALEIGEKPAWRWD